MEYVSSELSCQSFIHQLDRCYHEAIPGPFGRQARLHELGSLVRADNHDQSRHACLKGLAVV